MKPDIVITPTLQELSKKAVEFLLESAAHTIGEKQRFNLVLAGGSTPKSTYRLLAEPQISKRCDWKKVHLFWGDERCVPPNHHNSNFHMASEALIKHIPIPIENIHRIKGEVDPGTSAAEYQQELLSYFHGESIVFDLVILGLGADGHTASLFPQTKALTSNDWVAANYVPKLESWRITMTAKTINAAKQIIFLVAGEGKAKTVSHILEGPAQSGTYPAQMIAPKNGTTLWLLDQHAASYLHDKYN